MNNFCTFVKHNNCMNDPVRHKKLIKNLTNNQYLSNRLSRTNMLGKYD